MPPRRRQQYRPRPRPQSGGQSGSRDTDRALDGPARRLAESHTVEELRALVERSREAYEQADQQSRDRPSPGALGYYRSATRALAEAEHALHLAENQ